MTSLTFSDYVTKVLPQKNEIEHQVREHTKNLCNTLKNAQLKEGRKYLYVSMNDTVLSVNFKNGEAVFSKKKKLFHLLNEDSRNSCLREFLQRCKQ